MLGSGAMIVLPTNPPSGGSVKVVMLPQGFSATFCSARLGVLFELTLCNLMKTVSICSDTIVCSLCSLHSFQPHRLTPKKREFEQNKSLSQTKAKTISHEPRSRFLVLTKNTFSQHLPYEHESDTSAQSQHVSWNSTNGEQMCFLLAFRSSKQCP